MISFFQRLWRIILSRMQPEAQLALLPSVHAENPRYFKFTQNPAVKHERDLEFRIAELLGGKE